MSNDSIKWWPTIEVIKYNPDTCRDLTDYLGYAPQAADLRRMELTEGLVPDDILVVEGNALVTVGQQRLSDLVIGTGQAFTTTRGMTGVGDSATAWGAGNTALLGTNQYYQALDGAPTSVNGTITAATTYTSGNANFVWNEWCWAIATATPVSSASFTTATTTGVMFNRKVQSLGTKASGAVWTLQASVAIS